MPGRDEYIVEIKPEVGSLEAFRRIERSLRSSARFAERIRGAGALSAVAWRHRGRDGLSGASHTPTTPLRTPKANDTPAADRTIPPAG